MCFSCGACRILDHDEFGIGDGPLERASGEITADSPFSNSRVASMGPVEMVGRLDEWRFGLDTAPLGTATPRGETRVKRR